MGLDPTDPRSMGLAAGSSGGKFGFMNEYMKTFQQTTREQWKNAAAYQEEFKETSWTEARSFVQILIGFISKLSIVGEVIQPFTDLLEVFDAEVIKEFADEIKALNEAIQELYPAVRSVVGVIRSFVDWMKEMREAFQEMIGTTENSQYDLYGVREKDNTGYDINDPNSGWYRGPAQDEDFDPLDPSTYF